MTRRPCIVITLGDPCGIGPELLLTSLHAINRWTDVVVVGARAGVDLLGPGRVHLLPYDLLDLAEHPVPERQPRVDAGADLADVTRPDEQLVALDLGVGRIVAQRAQEQGGHPHGRRE